jgi:DNA polymerase-3 subunit delta
MPKPRAFWDAVQSGSFESAYYLYGDDDFLREEAARAITDGAVDGATRDFNLDVRTAADLDARSLNSLLDTPPWMAMRRVVVLRDIGNIRKDARTVLDIWLSDPTRGVVVVMVTAGGERAKADKIFQDRACVVELQSPVGDELDAWITDHAKRRLQRSVTPAAVELLRRSVGDDLTSLATELDKVASYTGGGDIDEAAVGEVVGVRRGETLGDFLDRVAERDSSGALALLPQVLQQPKTTGVSVVMALATQTLALAWAEAMPGRADFYTLLNSSKAYTGRPWGEAVKTWTSAVRRWDAESLDAALETLLAADAALKDTRLSSDEQILTNVVLALGQ